MCTTVDHYASTYGDKGWGCGYRYAFSKHILSSSLIRGLLFCMLIRTNVQEKSSKKLCFIIVYVYFLCVPYPLKTKIVPYEIYLENLGSLRDLSFLICIYKKFITLIFIILDQTFSFLTSFEKWSCAHCLERNNLKQRKQYIASCLSFFTRITLGPFINMRDYFISLAYSVSSKIHKDDIVDWKRNVVKTKVMRISWQPSQVLIVIDQNNWRMWHISTVLVAW